MAFWDIALVYDPQARRCTLALGEDGDLLVDETSITPVLLSIGLDRRAAPDDELPTGRTEFLAPASFSERRGSVGDALDPDGELTGSRCWLSDREKETEQTRDEYAFWLSESLAWAEPETGVEPEIDVQWVAPGRLGYRIFVADAALNLTQTVG